VSDIVRGTAPAAHGAVCRAPAPPAACAPTPAGSVPGAPAAETLRFVTVSARDPLATPLLVDLGREYDERYADMRSGEDEVKEIDRYPAEAFDPPHGCFLLLLEGDEPVAGGAFMRRDEETAELKRIWTSAGHRGRGLGRRVLAELERRASVQGYTRACLTTGPRQPEAVALYLRCGYTPLYDRSLPPETVGMHPFEKSLRG
jgi:GNAT superfamily N-acetyltransferase